MCIRYFGYSGKFCTVVMLVAQWNNSWCMSGTMPVIRSAICCFIKQPSDLKCTCFKKINVRTSFTYDISAAKQKSEKLHCNWQYFQGFFFVIQKEKRQPCLFPFQITNEGASVRLEDGLRNLRREDRTIPFLASIATTPFFSFYIYNL